VDPLFRFVPFHCFPSFHTTNGFRQRCRPQTCHVGLFSFLPPSLRATDGLGVQVPGNLIRPAGLPGSSATFEWCLLSIYGHSISWSSYGSISFSLGHPQRNFVLSTSPTPLPPPDRLHERIGISHDRSTLRPPGGQGRRLETSRYSSRTSPETGRSGRIMSSATSFCLGAGEEGFTGDWRLGGDWGRQVQT
jgi:hypothetical protein